MSVPTGAPPAVARRRAALPWPLPALAAWALAWGVFGIGTGIGASAGLPVAAAWLLAALSGGVMSLPMAGGWRRALMAAGFPLSSLAMGAAVPPWLWLASVVPLLLAYPLRAWSDAPFFPTPAQALRQLADSLPLAPGARVLDAGCGLGHGLAALHRVWPQAQVEGVEWSAPMAWLCARRCGFARVRRGDMWAQPWSGHDLVYLFQRPESMARAWAKARAEMSPGSWLVSLEFAVPDVAPLHRLDAGGGRPLWVYRLPSAGVGSNRGRSGR